MANFGKLDFNISLKPTSAFPLDARCYFESLEDAEAAAATAEEAGSTNTIYYYGQKLVVVANGVATWYTVQPDKTLKKDGSGDENVNSGDMLKSVYDTDNNGKIDKADKADDADKLGGQSPSYYAKADDLKGYVSTSALADAVEDMTEIASGKCACYVFDTVDALDSALTEYVAYISNGTAMAETNILKNATLKTGDVFLIRAVDVPDYWWDESTKKKQILETTKVDLSTISNAEIDTIVAS